MKERQAEKANLREKEKAMRLKVKVNSREKVKKAIMREKEMMAKMHWVKVKKMWSLMTKLTARKVRILQKKNR